MESKESKVQGIISLVLKTVAIGMSVASLVFG